MNSPRRVRLCQIWCLANETRFHVNKSVDATIRSVVVGGLQAGVQYRVEVAAGTSAGVGVKSKAQLIILGNPLSRKHTEPWVKWNDLIMGGPGCPSQIGEGSGGVGGLKKMIYQFIALEERRLRFTTQTSTEESIAFH